MNERKESQCPSTHNYIQAYTKEWPNKTHFYSNVLCTTK